MGIPIFIAVVQLLGVDGALTVQEFSFTEMLNNIVSFSSISSALAWTATKTSRGAVEVLSALINSEAIVVSL